MNLPVQHASPILRLSRATVGENTSPPGKKHSKIEASLELAQNNLCEASKLSHGLLEDALLLAKE